MEGSAGDAPALGEAARQRRLPARRIIILAGAILAVLLAGLAFSRAIGFVPAGLYTTDYVFLAEGARRIALGQTPHVDYSAPVGPLVFWLMSLARQLPVLGPDVFALNVLMWGIVAVPAGIVALRLRSPWMALACLGIAALPVLSPFNLEEMTGVCEVNHNGIYNRHGAALLFVTFVAGLTRPRSPLWDGLLFAWLLAAMLLTKVTYGIAGAAFLAVAALVSPPRLRAYAVALATVGAAGLLLEAGTGVVSGYAGDLLAIGRLNSSGVAAYLTNAFWGNTLIVLVGLGLVATLAGEARAGSAPGAEAIRRIEPPALAGACLALTLWTESQSTGGAGLIGLSALVFSPALADGRWARLKVALATGLVLLTTGWFADQVFRRGRCLLEQAPAYRTNAALSALIPGMRAAPGRLGAAELTARLWQDHRALADDAYRSGFDFHLESYGAPVSFLANAFLAQEAADRFRALSLEVRHVMTLGFVDDFTPLLNLPPAPGAKLVLDPYRTVGDLTNAEASAYLAPIDAAFERTCAVPLYMRQIAGFFRFALEEAFEPAVLTPCWTVHLRRGAAPRGT